MQALLRRTLSAAWILLSLGSALARGQDGSPRLKRIGKREGLQGHEIRALLRDPNGMLWIGTEKALLRFDMYGCVSVEPGGSEAPEDGKLEVTSLELLEGRLWAGTKHGLYYFDPEQGLLHPARSLVQGAAEGLDLPVLSLTKDSRGRLWVGSRGGLGYIESRSFRPVVPEPSLLPERAHTTEVAFVSFLLDRERLWVGTENHGLLLLDLNMLRLSRHALRLASGKEAFMIGCMQRTGAGRLWVGSTDAGLLEYDPLDGSASAVELAAWKGRHWRSVVTAIAEDSDGRTWLGTAGNGVLVLPPERGDGIALKAAPDSRTSLPDNRIRILYRDDLGTLWIGSNRGVCVVDDRMGPFRNHEPSRSEEGPPGKDGYRTRVLSIWKDANGSVWVGTQGDGLQILDAGSGRYRRYGEGRGQARPLEVVSALLRDRAGVLWAGGYGLFRMDGDAFQRIELPERQRIPPPLRRNPKLGTWVKNMLEDRAGRLWVNNHFRVCVLSADRRSWKSYELEKPASNLVEDERGRIWAATMGAGLLEIDPGRQLQRYHKRDPRLTDGLPSDMLSYVARGHAGKFWFSCNKGFGSFEERTGKVQTYALTKSRIGSVHGIVEDGSNRLWLCAGKALYRFDPETAHVQVFDRFDFSRLGRFQKRTIHRARDGELFFGRERGITRVHPDACYARNPGPELRLGAVRILDRLLWPGDPELDGSRLTLAHDRSYLTFMVTDMDVFHTESRRFSFQLAGLDTRWMESEHASIHCSHLPAGEYRLRVRASDAHGIWTAPEAVLDLRVVPPVWQRTWFRWAALLALLLAGGFLFRRRARAGAARARELNGLAGKRIRELETRTAELQSIQQFTATIDQSMRLEDLLDRLLSGLPRLLGIDHARMLARDAGLFRFRTPPGSEDQGLVERQLSPEEALESYVRKAVELERGILLLADDGPGSPAWTGRVVTYVLPIESEGELEAVLLLDQDASGERLNSDRLATLACLRGPITRAFHKTRLLDELGELNERRAEILGMAAHDLEDPLHRLTLTVSVLVEELESGRRDLASSREELASILRSARQMSERLDRLLPAAAVEQGKLGVGSTFSFSLPVAKDSPGGAAPES